MLFMLQYRSIAFKLKTDDIMMTSLTKLTKNETADCVSCYPYVLVGPQDMDFSVEGKEGRRERRKEERRERRKEGRKEGEKEAVSLRMVCKGAANWRELCL